MISSFIRRTNESNQDRTGHVIEQKFLNLLKLEEIAKRYSYMWRLNKTSVQAYFILYLYMNINVLRCHDCII